MSALILDHDWSATPLGEPVGWPQSLRTLVDVLLGSSQPMFVAWGPERTLLYNDAYAEILADKHPLALGHDFLTVWSEIRADLLPIVEEAYNGRPVQMDDIQLAMERKGYPEETHFSFSYTPVRDDSGAVAGLFCPCVETTDLVLAERRRAADAERQRRLFEQAPGFITILSGPEHVFEFCNAAYRRLIGGRQAVGRTVRDALPELEAQGFFELLDLVFRTGERFVAERSPILLENPGGLLEERFLDFIYEPVTDEAGEITGIFVEGQDVTERVLAEAALRESNAQFRLMADAVPQIVWITDAEGSTEFFNKQWTDYTGVAYEPTTAAQIAAAYVHPDDAAETVAAFDEARRAGTTFQVEHRIRSVTGDYRWFLVRGEPYRDPQTGKIVRWFGASVDIHDRKLAEAGLRKLNETLDGQVAERTALLRRYQNIVEATAAAICAFDTDYRLVAFNRAHNDEFRRVNGFDTKLGDVFPDLFVPEQGAVMRKLMDRALSGETFTITEGFGRPELGTPIWEITYTPLRNEAGDIIGAFHHATDISSKLVAEAELQAAQEALRQSQKMEAMGSLTGGVAHDFNNLLTPIIGSLDMLMRKGVGSERERRLIDGALQSAERAKTLVQRLLAFARRQPLQPVAVDLGRLVEGMVELIDSTLGPTIDVRVELAPDLPPAKVDPNQLEMALLNLAVNARDAMPEGGELTITAKRESIRGPHPSSIKPGHYVRVCVGDSGAGMDEDTLRRAIEPFFSTKGIGKGTGLGLSMVHGLALQLGGGMGIESAPGQGTTVQLWLPISADPIGREGNEPALPNGPIARGTVLLVDDEELVRMSTADMLVDLGFEVVEAGSAEDALRLIRSGAAPDLLVTDHLMPGMSGAELAKEVRALRPELPVLIVSGYAEVEGIAPDLPRLTKPFRSAELTAIVSALVPEGQGGAENR